MDILGKIPHFSVKRIKALIDRGLVRPLTSDSCDDEDEDDEVEAKSVVVSTTADRWYSILKSEREEMDRVRLDRDQMRMRYEMSEFTRQKEEEMNHILRKKEIEMEKRLRTSHYLPTSHQKRSLIRLMRHRPAHGDHTNRDTNLLAIQHGNTRSVVAHAALLHQNFQHLQAPLELGNRSRSNLKKSPACTSGASGLGWND